MTSRQAKESGAARGYSVRGTTSSAPQLEPGLYVVATPIGHLGDVTLRALETLAAADLIACEDTRVTRRLLDRYGIKTKLTAYHEHSGPAVHARLLKTLKEGGAVALASDAGTPLISDPGARLVANAHEAGIRVTPIPGPSAAVAALSAAGLEANAFLFLGFLPTKSGQRRTRLSEVADVPAALALFESPNRAAALLADAAETLGATREAALCREITKLHETFDRGSLSDLAARYRDTTVKGEIVLLIAPPDAAAPPDEAEVDALLRAALGSAGVKQAAADVADMTGLPRRTLYQRALALKGKE